MHYFESRRMDRVTAEVAQKIFVLFEDDDFDSSTRQQKAKHHSRRAAAGDATTGFHVCRVMLIGGAGESKLNPTFRHCLKT